MTLEQLTTFFAWTSLLHIAVLTLTTLALVSMRGWVAGVHARLFGVDAASLAPIYFGYLAAYKLGIFLFALGPYLVLRFAF